jgi:hypothetical protein
MMILSFPHVMRGLSSEAAAAKEEAPPKIREESRVSESIFNHDGVERPTPPQECLRAPQSLHHPKAAKIVVAKAQRKKGTLGTGWCRRALLLWCLSVAPGFLADFWRRFLLCRSGFGGQAAHQTRE